MEVSDRGVYDRNNSMGSPQWHRNGSGATAAGQRHQDCINLLSEATAKTPLKRKLKKWFSD
jgi:hypothetical protein